MGRLAVWVIGLGVAFAATPARADIQSSPFNPTKVWRPTEFPAETGWAPSSGPLQVNLKASAFQEVMVAKRGDGLYDWDQLAITFEGEPGAGNFVNTLGVEVIACIRVDALGVMQEFEVGVYNIDEQAAGTFDPYLLLGNPDRPVVVAESIGPNDLVNEDFDILGIPGTLDIDYRFDIPGISYQGTHIDLTDSETSVAVIGSVDQENQLLDVILPGVQPESMVTAWATQYGQFSSEIALHLLTTVDVEVAGVPFSIGPLDLVIDFPVVSDEEVVFDPLALNYTAPPAPPSGSDGADSTSGGGEADGGGATTGSADGSTGAQTGGIGSGLGSSGDGSSGCGCRRGGPADRGNPVGTLFILAFAALTRRRART